MHKKLLALVLAVALVASLAILPAAAAGKFPDAVGTWAESSIDRWADAGLIQGDTNGNVNPTQNLTRAEMAAILVRLMGLAAKADVNTFSDVAADDWFADVVLKCAAAKIMLGDGEGRATPNDAITREQAATMICRALGLKAKASHSLEQFDDAKAVSSYAKDYMATLTSLGALKGVGNGSLLAPQQHIDRASALALLDRLIKAYVTTAGEVKVDDANGFVVINTADAGNVTITGDAAGVLVATGNKADVKLSKLNADTVKVDSPVAVTIDGSTKLGTVEVNAAAKVDSKGVVGDLQLNDKDATSNVTTDNSKPSGGSSGGSYRPSSNKPHAVTFAYTTAGEAVAEGETPVYTAANVTGLDEDGKARKNTEITFTVAGASEEYPVVEVTSAEVNCTEAEGVYTFTMPNTDVTITINAATEAPAPEEPAVKDAKIVFITAENYETLAPTYNYYGATAETLRPAADVQLPWLLVEYDRAEAGEVSISVKKDDAAVKFGSGDDEFDALTFTASAANPNAWISFHMASQADTDHKGQTWLKQDAATIEGAYEVTVTMGEDSAEATATYTATTTPDEPAVKDAKIVFITEANYATLAPTYNYYGATAETLRPAADVQLPWLLVEYNRAKAGEVSISVKKDGAAVKFGSGDDEFDALTFTASAANPNAWISFHMASQADTDHKGQTWLNQAAAAGAYEVTVTMGEDSAKATATYTATTTPDEPAASVVTAANVAAMTDAQLDGFNSWTGCPTNVADIHEDVSVAVDGTTIKVTGTLKYVEGFTGFNTADEAEQEGNYFALHLQRPNTISGTSTVVLSSKNGDKAPIELTDADPTLDVIFHVATKASAPTLKIDWDGNGTDYKETTYTLDFSGVTLAAKGGEEPAPATILGVTLTMTQMSEENALGYCNYLVRTTRTAKFTQANIKITNEAGSKTYVNYTFTYNPADMNETGGVGMEWSLHELANDGTATGDDTGAQDFERDDEKIVPAGNVKVTITVTGVDGKTYTGEYTYEITEAMRQSVKMPTQTEPAA